MSSLTSDYLQKLRTEYLTKGLSEADIDVDPVNQFTNWFQQSVEVGIQEPNAMIVATATSDGKPSVRAVLMKECTAKGISFFTNYESRKGKELASNPFVSALFFWEALKRQVRVEGIVEKLPRNLSDQYFHMRPIDSQISAMTSHQSTIIPNRDVLEERFQQLKHDYEGKQIPLPDYWGGYLIKPSLFEFWQGRENRLHDRLRYRLDDGKWIIERLSP
jgi:pyridoxamine 5'-phosphate oxidase